MTEQWIKGCAVQRISFRDGLVLDMEDYNELVISAPLALTLPATETDPQEVVAINPADVRKHERPLFDFAGQKCTHAEWDDTGSLHLAFADGHRIDVPTDQEHTSWELYGKRHGYAACLPHGRVRVVRHDLPDDEAVTN
ncbi:DUF6188 family protein [Mycolicibacterium sp. lyk4-40-TYG-92]|jgi:hypothetical protein|uniref:DUF6188 family protein n=1 Tax=Mycolicibacterium sp. lyk4-40-TYG-92 TaxID=3040295 RepID=UPI0025502EBA|nr:DUF6188 family protein [Mycolicibacterium sp. lyk4-40-TYG-92]